MYIISLTYKRDEKEIAPLRESHIKWVQEQHEKGIFIAAGVKIPLTGGFILAKTMPRYELDDLLATDPFEKVVDYIVMDVEVRDTLPEFSGLKDI